MGNRRLLRTLRIRLKTKGIPHKLITLAEHIKAVGALGLDIDTAGAFFIAKLECKPEEFDIQAAQVLDALKCQLTDPATDTAIKGPGGARLTVALHNEVGVSKPKEVTRSSGTKTALLKASEAARNGGLATAHRTWEHVADRKLAATLMLLRFLAQDLWFQDLDIYMVAAPDESDALLATDHDAGEPIWGLHLQDDRTWQEAPVPQLPHDNIIAVTNDFDVLGAGRRKRIHVLRSWRRAGYKVDRDDIARVLNIDPTMHAVVQAALGADYFSGAMTPAKALAAIDVTDELRAPQGLSLTEIIGPFLANYDQLHTPLTPEKAANTAKTMQQMLRCVAGLTKGHVVRGPSSAALYLSAASNVYSTDLAGRPMDDIVYTTPVDSAGARSLIRFKATVVAGKLRSSSSAEQLTRGCCTSLPLLREMQGKRCDALDYAVGFGADAYFGREDLYGEVGDFGRCVRWDVTWPLGSGDAVKISTPAPWNPGGYMCTLTPGAEVLNFLDSDLDPDEACEWTHKIAGTNQTLFSAPMRQSLHLLHLGSTLVRDVVEFVWEQLPEDATTSKYTMTFHKQADTNCGVVEHSLDCKDAQGVNLPVRLKADGWAAWTTRYRNPGHSYADASEPGFLTVPLSEIARHDMSRDPRIIFPIKGSAADSFISEFSSGAVRTYALQIGGHALLSVRMRAITSHSQQIMPISAALEAAADALAEQMPGQDALLCFAQVPPGATCILAKVTIKGAEVEGINLTKVKERVLEALQQPIHFTTCAWPAQFVPAAIVTGAKDFYIGVATRRDLGFASLEVSTAELAVDNETIPDVIVTLANDGYLRGSLVRLFLCAILQALNETNMSAERPALLLKVTLEGGRPKRLDFTGAALDPHEDKLLRTFPLGTAKVIDLVEESATWRVESDGCVSRPLEGLAGQCTKGTNPIRLPENVVSKLGLKHLETDKPKGSVILDLGHPKFKKDLSYQFASTTNSPMHMAITANQLVPALKRCLPHSASEIRAVLQHADGVISIRFVHAKLGTPIDPNWDHMGLALGGNCTSIYARVDMDQAFFKFDARLTQDTVRHFFKDAGASMRMTVPVPENRRLSEQWRTKRTRLGLAILNEGGGKVADCRTAPLCAEARDCSPERNSLVVTFFNGMALASVLRGALAAAADSNTADPSSLAAAAPSPFCDDTFTATCYLHVEIRLGSGSHQEAGDVAMSMAVRDGKGANIPVSKELLDEARKKSGMFKRSEADRLKGFPGDGAGCAAAAAADAEPQTRQRVSGRKRKQIVKLTE